MTLFVASKRKCQPPTTTAFQEVERWANAYNPLPLVFDTNWADTATFQATTFTVDPFGWVHVTGIPTYTGTIAGSASATIGTIPQPFAPRNTVRVPAIAGVGRVFTVCELEVNGTALVLLNSSAGALVDPSVPLSFVYDPRL